MCGEVRFSLADVRRVALRTEAAAAAGGAGGGGSGDGTASTSSGIEELEASIAPLAAPALSEAAASEADATAGAGAARSADGASPRTPASAKHEAGKDHKLGSLRLRALPVGPPPTDWVTSLDAEVGRDDAFVSQSDWPT